ISLRSVRISWLLDCSFTTRSPAESSALSTSKGLPSMGHPGSLTFSRAAPERGASRLRQKETIVAGGAFNSPQLLMLSRIGPPSQIEKHKDPSPGTTRGSRAQPPRQAREGRCLQAPFEPNIYKGCTWGADGDPCLAELKTGAPDGA